LRRASDVGYQEWLLPKKLTYGMALKAALEKADEMAYDMARPEAHHAD
jgi:hypothetical protein